MGSPSFFGHCQTVNRPTVLVPPLPFSWTRARRRARIRTGNTGLSGRQAISWPAGQEPDRVALEVGTVSSQFHEW